MATPLGNTGDMSPRAIDVLQKVNYIAAEDTRTAARLLSELGVGNRLVSYYEQNQHLRHDMFLRDLKAGRSIAVISEAGMPCISDPGEGIVRAAEREGLPVSVIPGPSALLSAVAASGFDTGRFVTKDLSLPKEKTGEGSLYRVREADGYLYQRLTD